MKSAKVFRRWQRRGQVLQAELRVLIRRCRRQGNAEQVHALRVTLRRLRLFVRVGRPLLSERTVGAFREWAHRASKLTSPVRDLDVAMEWLRKERGAAAAISRCQPVRDRLWRQACPQLTRPPKDLLITLAERSKAGDAPSRLARRVRKLERRYEAAVKAALPRFFRLRAGEQHEFRRTLRWWRYLRELTLPPRRQAGDKLLGALVAAQETTGDRQNLSLTMAALREHGQARAVGELLKQLGRMQAGQHEKIRKSLAALARLRSWGRLIR